ncbi:putative interferon-induced very large GTPase 1-like [Apostichopus japonicus]|uniref:Putative interferon-induced very large GTPase 1-like n=1 Tax=Stichopus japonicus TaxID=307972 RepID=A0A2G8JWG5_STIJA|nr:putative interferon-induced very large GTPase 1-like [Apostichopus japonicus]
MAAELLLSGHPLEIFDGDVCHVPIKWVKGILAAVRRIIGDASVNVISVIGIQSSDICTCIHKDEGGSSKLILLLIQQFVADVTAQYRNQSSTQSILQKLDQAVITAATEERKEDQYRQFSDCFNIVNIDNKEDNVQYIPSLWRGSMSSPNHDYSETVLKLKSALLREMKDSTTPQKLSDFEERISSVWNAVKQEDFVFNFRNTTEISQYNTFSQMFKRQQLRLIGK